MKSGPFSILIIVPGRPQDSGLERFYESAFRTLGYNVHVLNANGPSSIVTEIKNRVRRRVSRLGNWGLKPDIEGEYLMAAASKIKPHLTVSFRCERLKASTIKELSSRTALGCINIYQDHPFVIPGNGAVQLTNLLREYATVFTFSESLVPVFYQLGAKRVEWLPFAYDPGTTVH